MWISQKNVYRWGAKSHQSSTSQRTKASDCINFSFPKSLRILKREQFKAITRLGNRFWGAALSIEYCLSDSLKIGITVPKKYGNAVKRNLFKRRVREAFRLCQQELIPSEIVVMPRKKNSFFSLEILIKDFMEFHYALTQSSTTKSR